MNFEKYLTEQINLHPSVMPQDIVKMCYQAAFGAEHLLSNINSAKAYFDKEYSETKAMDIPLYEKISDDICRVNLSAWKKAGLPGEWLFRMFVGSCDVQNNGNDTFSDYLKTAEKILLQINICFSFSDWQEYLSEYKKHGLTAVHHSPEYRECEKPAYRIVNSQYMRLLPVLKKASEFKNKLCVIAIDGRAASGKSTMAKHLKMILGADIIQMDDFFLPKELRTDERYNEIGGNVHYERFIDEVLPFVSLPQSFAYRQFDCSKMDFGGECVIENKNFRIVEGSYSCHPKFGKYADITVFSDVAPDEQMERIFSRNGSEMAEIFRTKWIPLEEKYFLKYSILQNADIRL